MPKPISSVTYSPLVTERMSASGVSEPGISMRLVVPTLTPAPSRLA
jgi:hypothetical protein